MECARTYWRAVNLCDVPIMYDYTRTMKEYTNKISSRNIFNIYYITNDETTRHIASLYSSEFHICRYKYMYTFVKRYAIDQHSIKVVMVTW